MSCMSAVEAAAAKWQAAGLAWQEKARAPFSFRLLHPEKSVGGHLFHKMPVSEGTLAGLPQSAYILAQPIGWYRIPANVADILRSVTFGTEVVFDVMTQAEAISLEHESPRPHACSGATGAK